VEEIDAWPPEKQLLFLLRAGCDTLLTMMNTSIGGICMVTYQNYIAITSTYECCTKQLSFIANES